MARYENRRAIPIFKTGALNHSATLPALRHHLAGLISRTAWQRTRFVMLGVQDVLWRRRRSRAK
jgi:hypothetical protein